MQILIISYFFPPCSTGAGTVMYDLCKSLPEGSYDVITARKDFCVNIGAYDPNYVLHCKTTRLSVSTSSTFDRAKFFFLAILNGLYLGKKDGLDCILTIYPYFCDLLAAYVLHKLTRRPLVIQMHDIFSETKKGLMSRIWRIAENHVFSQAAKILVMTQAVKDYYFERGISNTAVFPTPINLDDINETMAWKEPVQRPLKIVYTGSIYNVNETATRVFLEAARDAKDLKIVFAVPSIEHVSEPLRSYLKDVSVGFLTRKKCIELQRSADILLLTGSQEKRVWYNSLCYPCKVSAYLLAGKPILAIIPKGFIDDFIKKHQVGITVTQFSREKVLCAIDELRRGEERKFFSENALKTARLFDSRILGRQLSLLLSEIVVESRTSAKRDQSFLHENRKNVTA